MPKLRLAIIGATGFTGMELVRLLLHHPYAHISAVTSETHGGKAFSEVYPVFLGQFDRILVPFDKIDPDEIDIAFLALPHGVSMSFVRQYASSSLRIVDLSGDFRLSTPGIYEKWYGQNHVFPKGFEEAVYGLPELNARAIQKAKLVANPGCYPTSALLGLAPLFQGGVRTSGPVIVDAKSGVTGTGINTSLVNHFDLVNENFRAYAVKHHRHTVEIEEQLRSVDPDAPAIRFTPHLLPVDRGILSTIYIRPESPVSDTELREIYHTAYTDKAFIRIRKEPPGIKDVRGTNLCDIYATYDERTGLIIVLSAIDNVVRGASGQAIQNMNIMTDQDEATGLISTALFP